MPMRSNIGGITVFWIGVLKLSLFGGHRASTWVKKKGLGVLAWERSCIGWMVYNTPEGMVICLFGSFFSLCSSFKFQRGTGLHERSLVER